MAASVRGRARRIGRALLPPAMTAVWRHLQAGRASEWRYEPTWPRSTDQGWHEPEISATQARRLDAFARSIEAPCPLGASAEADATDPPSFGVQNTYLAFAYAFACAALERQPVRVLDWGGGLGQYHLLARSLFPGVAMSWVCHDLAPVIERGRAVVEETEFETDPERVLGSTYGLVLASGSLHYAEDWRTVLKGLCGAADFWLYVTRLPVVTDASDYVVVQRAHRHGYPTSYPGWVVNRGNFLDPVTAEGFILVRELLLADRSLIPRAPEQPEYRGFLLRRDEGGAP